MVHILLTILKIVGILLLVILGLLLFLVLSLLFVPLCYSGQGKRYEKKMWGKASVSWLFHLIHGRVIYDGERMAFEVYLFGIPLLAAQEKFAAWKKKRAIKKASTETVREREPSKEVKSVQAESEQEPPKEVETVETESERKPKQEVKPIQPEKPSAFTVFWEKVKTVAGKILRLPAAILGKIRKIRLTFQNFCDKIRRWREFLKAETTKEALRFLLEKGKGLLRHILPRKIKGMIQFGFEDPALTGQVLGAAAMFYPFYGKTLQLQPVFDQQVLEGEIFFSGRMFGCYFLWTAWKIYRKKEVKRTYQRFQNKEA